MTQQYQIDQLELRGWLLLESIYDGEQLADLRAAVGELAKQQDEAVRGRGGAVYAARNVLQLVPDIVNLWRTPRLVNLLTQTLGQNAGLVRGLYFDKPPEQTWALPWHKDLLIAVSDGTCQSIGYSKPRLRAGILHVEPPVEVLQSMLTLRIHLDEMTLENGPLEVLTGSHATGKQLLIDGFEKQVITSQAGDVLAMRPLLVHASGRSIPNLAQHRRVLHLEFSGMPQLPSSVNWHTFHPINCCEE